MQSLFDGTGAGRSFEADVNGEWRVRLQPIAAPGALFAVEPIMSPDSSPPLPETVTGFISWAGNGLLVLDQDPSNGTHGVVHSDVEFSPEADDPQGSLSEEDGARLASALVAALQGDGNRLE